MARTFNGTSDKIAVNGAGVGPNWFSDSYALSVWVKGGSGHGNTGVYSEGVTTNNNAFWWIGPDSTTTTVMRWTGGTSGGTPSGIKTTATVFDSTWHNYVLSVTANTYWIYVDGTLDSTANIGATFGGMGTPTRATIGALGRSSYTSFFNGSIEEFAIWTGSNLSAAAAKAISNGLPASLLAPTHYWPVWGQDSPEPDIGTGTHTTGTLTGTTAANSARIGRRLLTLA